MCIVGFNHRNSMYIPSKLIERFDDLLVNNCTVYTSGKKKVFFLPKLNEDK